MKALCAVLLSATLLYGQQEELAPQGYVVLRYPDDTVGPLDEHVLALLWLCKYEQDRIHMAYAERRVDYTRWLLYAIQDKTLALLWPEQPEQTELIEEERL